MMLENDVKDDTRCITAVHEGGQLETYTLKKIGRDRFEIEWVINGDLMKIESFDSYEEANKAFYNDLRMVKAGVKNGLYKSYKMS